MKKITDPFILRFSLKNEKTSIQVRLLLRSDKSFKIIESILGEQISQEPTGWWVAQVDSIKLRQIAKCPEVIKISQ